MQPVSLHENGRRSVTGGGIKGRVGFLCTNTYPIFDESVNANVGGMETRSALFARGLARSGRWNMRFFVGDFGQPEETIHGNITFYIYQPTWLRAATDVYPRFRKRRWFPIINGTRSELKLLWRIPLVAVFRFLPGLCFPPFWRRHPVDIICCFGNNYRSAETIADCKRVGTVTVLCLASDLDLSDTYSPGAKGANDYGEPRWMCHYAVANADYVVVQSETQRRMLRDRFGRKGVLIRNPVVLDRSASEPWPERARRDLVLWIGRSDTFNKRPALFLELARRCPDLRFLMIVNQTNPEVLQRLHRERPVNLEIIQRVPHSEIWNYYRRARAFVNTSNYEGFPNTFLQSGVAGVPIVSMEVDPEGIFDAHGCGLNAHGSPDALEAGVRRVWAEHGFAETLASRMKDYVVRNHDFEGRLKEFDEFLARTLFRPAPRQSERMGVIDYIFRRYSYGKR